MKSPITPAPLISRRERAARAEQARRQPEDPVSVEDMPMTVVANDRNLSEQNLDILRQAGNPFRNYFARNPDDEVCARFHVPELFARERSQLLGVVDLYRTAPGTHSEMVPVLGNKGAGKTHLLHSIKHGSEGAWQLLVTPGTYQKDTDFMEYLLFQTIDTLLGGAKQKGRRPLEFVSERLSRSLLHRALCSAGKDELMDLFPAPGLGRWTRKLGLGSGQAQERAQWLIDTLARPASGLGFAPLRRLCAESNVAGESACEFLAKAIDRTEPRDAAGLIRRHLYQGFARAALAGDESDLANFLTYGFAELDFQVRPSRQDLVLSLFKVLMEVFQGLKVPVVMAFDQLEDLLLARRSDDGHRTAEAFFAGIVKAMHQIDGICFLIFAERGLWNRFVPSLDGYIQDRLNNPVHVPGHGTVKALRLEAPPAELVRQVAQARLRTAAATLPDKADLSPLYPFLEEQVDQIARTEPTLRDMLQQLRHLFDHLVYGEVQKTAYDEGQAPNREAGPTVKSFVLVETTGAAHGPKTVKEQALEPPAVHRLAAGPQVAEAWDVALEAARTALSPEGSLTGATRELQAGLGAFLQTGYEHGVKVGPWRLQHVVPEWTFGEHPTYGAITIAHWVCKDGQPWKVGIGLFLGRGAGKPKDLEIKLTSLEATPQVIDHLILLRPEDDLALTGKSKTVWQDAERRGRHARLEPANLDSFAMLYGFPRWLTALSEGLPAGQPLPNLADLIQERCEKLLEQVCMPVP
jgi:hypothetical protein